VVVPPLNFTVRRVVSGSDFDSRPPRRIVLFYVLLGVSLCAIVAAAVWIMPRVPGYWDLRWVVALGLIVVIILLMGALAKLCGLTEEDQRRIFPKSDDTPNNRWRGP
jgi:hypothetical protein